MQHPALDREKSAVQGIAERGEDEDRGIHVPRAQGVLHGHDEVADTRRPGDHLGHDGDDQREGKAHAHAGEDVRHARRQHHAQGGAQPAYAQGACNVDGNVVHRAHAGNGVDEHREKGRERDDEDLHRVVHSEQQDQRRDDRRSRNRPQQLYHRLKRRVHYAHAGHEQPDDKRGAYAERIAGEHAIEARAEHFHELARGESGNKRPRDVRDRRPVGAGHPVVRRVLPEREEQRDQQEAACTSADQAAEQFSRRAPARR